MLFNLIDINLTKLRTSDSFKIKESKSIAHSDILLFLIQLQILSTTLKKPLSLYFFALLFR
ncbi:MAG: hypothetical protein CM15mP93_12970 [Thiotrichaceae bacterium]|nr:MAG: hypothetical protein CM15mP93_12970 [Thiotrichaceae bacterium]